MTNINMEQAPVGTVGTLLFQPGHLDNQHHCGQKINVQLLFSLTF